MTPREFIRQRARVERQFPPWRKRNQAMHRLVAESRAAIVTNGTRVAGWRLPCGTMVCVKIRYATREAADLELKMVRAMFTGGHRIPTRAYACRHCHGWHLTSQPARFDSV